MTTAQLAERVLTRTRAASVADAVQRLAGRATDEIDASLPRALEGERNQVHAYVSAYRELTSRLFDAISEARPDLVSIDEQDRVAIALERTARRGNGRTALWPRMALEQEAMSAPFSDWVGLLGAGRGTAVATAALMRAMLPGVEPLTPPRKARLPDWSLDELGLTRFYRAVLEELTKNDPLDHISAVLSLHRTELARLFGVRRQALDHWAEHGVPADRQEKLATVSEIVDLLAAKLKRERIPGVARRVADAYGERSMLDAIADGDEENVLTQLRDAFDWAAAA